MKQELIQSIFFLLGLYVGILLTFVYHAYHVQKIKEKSDWKIKDLEMKLKKPTIAPPPPAISKTVPRSTPDIW